MCVVVVFVCLLAVMGNRYRNRVPPYERPRTTDESSRYILFKIFFWRNWFKKFIDSRLTLVKFCDRQDHRNYSHKHLRIYCRLTILMAMDIPRKRARYNSDFHTNLLSRVYCWFIGIAVMLLL